MNIVTAKVPCSVCGKDYDATVIDWHIGYPHVCGDCLREIVSKWEREMTASIDKKIEDALLG